MSQELAKSQETSVTTGPGPALASPRNPFERTAADHINAGAVAIESERAVAEAQGKLVIAKRFPRDPFKAFERVMEACKRPGLAGAAFYSFSRGGQTVSGPSIRLAEELARCWGNIDYGMRELSNRDGVSELEAYAWDMETNTMSSQRFTVRHLRDTRQGTKELTDQRDIYEIGANMGARRLRARILAILPDDLVDAAVQQCKATIAHGGGESLADRIKRTVAAFAGRGVTVAMLEGHLGHGLEMTTPDELADLYGVFQAIKDGQAKVGDFFGAGAVPQATSGNLAAPAPQDQETLTPPPAAAPARRRGRPAKSTATAAEPAPAPANDNTPATATAAEPAPVTAAEPEPEPESESGPHDEAPALAAPTPATDSDDSDLF